MQTGVSVWLDVPLKALARRIAAVGTGSRPLLKHETGDVYNKVGNLSNVSNLPIFPPSKFFLPAMTDHIQFVIYSLKCFGTYFSTDFNASIVSF